MLQPLLVQEKEEPTEYWLLHLRCSKIGVVCETEDANGIHGWSRGMKYRKTIRATRVGQNG